MRVLLFTDTLGDVNGVSRFIRNSAWMARATGRDLQVLTSTRMEIPREENIHNVPPRWAGAMPGYSNLELALPAWREMVRRAEEMRPDAVHISTPGPVGLVGRRVARRLGVPMLGVYHTDFPAYIERLFENEALTWLCTAHMRWFYGPFARVFSRSEEYIDSLERLGIERSKCVRLRPGIRVEEFARGRCDGRVASDAAARKECSPECGEKEKTNDSSRDLAPQGSVRVLYVGRVSVEKNLPLLSRVWARATQELGRLGLEAELWVVGDGPYRESMERELAGAGVLGTVRFWGFKYGEELRNVYGSSDVFVFPSITDTLGQVVMEAQAAGLPVVVSNVGGPKEVVREGETGFVRSVTEVGAWVRAIVGLVADRARRIAMGRAAADFMKSFTMDRSFEHFWGVHEQEVERAMDMRGRVPNGEVRSRGLGAS